MSFVKCSCRLCPCIGVKVGHAAHSLTGLPHHKRHVLVGVSPPLKGFTHTEFLAEGGCFLVLKAIAGDLLHLFTDH